MRKAIRQVLAMAISAILILVLTAPGSAQVMSGGKYKVTSSVHSGGGGQTSGGNKAIEGTVGQSAAGAPVTGGSSSQTAGFWPTALMDPTLAPNGPATVQFSQPVYNVQEDLGAVAITVVRLGDATTPAAVDYQTVDASATQKSDFEYAAGTLNFAAGETSKTFLVLVNEDIYSESNETFNVTLSNPSGVNLGPQSTSMIAIGDDATEPTINSIDDPQQFVYMHYHDFLNREPDAAGLAFWTGQITSCGADPQCIQNKRINVSAAFFLSIEFQETGFLRYLLQRESFGSMPKYAEFMRDLQEVSRGVVVHTPGWQQKIKDNQQLFADRWIQRPAFKAMYDAMSNSDFVNALYANAGILPSPAERQALITALDSASQSRSAVLLEVAANAAFRQKEQNAAFVMMEYFSYLRRDLDASPDSDLSGYHFWLNKLNQFGGNYIDAEMVKAFIISLEYRQRFGP